MNEKSVRLLIFIFTAVLHIVVVFFLVIETSSFYQEPSEFARVMKVTDIAEYVPPPPSLPDPEIPKVEDIAETMTETEAPPLQEVISSNFGIISDENWLPIHLVSVHPHFDIESLTKDLVYPPIALRSGIEGRVVLELFVDSSGTVQRVIILREDPEGKGFAQAAVRAFTGRKGMPAYANGEAVSCRYRYPVAFRLK